jgi:hypothetical protein
MFNLFRKKPAPQAVNGAPAAKGRRIFLDGKPATVVGGRTDGMVKVVFDDGQYAYLATKEAAPEATLLSIIETLTPAQLEEVRRDMPPDEFEMAMAELKKRAK